MQINLSQTAKTNAKPRVDGQLEHKKHKRKYKWNHIMVTDTQVITVIGYDLGLLDSYYI
jgi:hypothetical protein